MSRGLLAPLAAAAVLGLLASAHSSPTRSPTVCAAGDVPARIAGKRTCLREGQRCEARFGRQYLRYGFRCNGLTLEVPWSVLRRPLHIPGLPIGRPCPVSRPDQRGDLKTMVGWGRGFPAWGSGPAYPVLVGPAGRPIEEGAVLAIEYPPPPGFGTEWGVAKVLWFTAPSYRGRVLVRGRQLDGPNEVRFEDGRPGFTDEHRLYPVHELRLEDDSRGHPATTRIRAAGCYAYQIDGRTFSKLIVFRAVLEQRP